MNARPWTHPRLRTWLRRPAVLTALSAGALAALLSGSLVVAQAVDGASGAPSSPTTTANGPVGANNVAVANNGTDGRTVYAIRLKIVQTDGPTVAPTNAAVAVASCVDCTTVAIAFEGVLVAGSPTNFTPTNLALAYNVNCSGCTTFADAFQQVAQHSTRVRITGAGRRQLAAIRRDLASLRSAGIPIDEVVARVAADEKLFADVLLNDCVPVGHVTDPAPAGALDLSDSPPGSTYPGSNPTSSAGPALTPSASSGGSGAPATTTAVPSSTAPAPVPTTSSATGTPTVSATGGPSGSVTGTP